MFFMYLKINKKDLSFLIFLVQNKLRKIDEMINSSTILKKNAKKYILNDRETTRSNFRYDNASTNCRSTLTDILHTQNSIYNSTGDFLMIKSSNFRNNEEYQKYLISKSNDKSINHLMTHIVIFF